ncbi:uncharacterized protein LOC135819317 isoform X3 [Sycon ciliatum]|uniref:uncharacterized protein LOC135819317 isoform X3 n=1 Tax=Sycon ciliatum TaxID=27933 RepID=UPI0031F62A59
MQRMRRKHSYGAGSRYCTTSWYGALRSAMCNRNYHGDTVDYRVKRCEMQQSIRRFDRRTREELMDDLSSVPLGSEQRRVLTLGLGYVPWRLYGVSVVTEVRPCLHWHRQLCLLLRAPQCSICVL